MNSTSFQFDNGNDLNVPKPLSTQCGVLKVVIAHWSEGLTVLNHFDDMQVVNAALDDHLFANFDLKNDCVSAWLNAIPDNVLKSARNIPRPYTSLLYAAASANSAQLLCSSPVLFALLVDHAVNTKLSQAGFAQIVISKRADQLQRVMGHGLNKPQSALKFLQRLDHQHLVKCDLDTIKNLLLNGDYHQFSHHQRIPVALLSLFKTYPLIRKNKWLFHLQNNQQCRDITNIIDDIISKSSALKVKGHFLLQIIQANNLNILKAHLDTLNEIIKVKADFLDKKPFPPAPVSGTDRIQPITNPDSLFMHGVLQDNCVFDYLQDIRSGDYYIYQITGKDSATLGVHIKYEGIVLVDQLLAASNKSVGDDLHHAVNQWIQNSSFSHSRIFNHCLSVDYKAKQQNQLMSDYREYSRHKPIRFSRVKHSAGFKDKQNNDVMNQYADYCALG